MAGDTPIHASLTAGLTRAPEIVSGGLRRALSPQGGELITLRLGDKAQVEQPVAVAFERRDRVDLGVAQRDPGQREVLREHLGRNGRDEAPGVCQQVGGWTGGDPQGCERISDRTGARGGAGKCTRASSGASRRQDKCVKG